MAKKFNQSLLNEELKKFKMISEYTFYTEEPKEDNDDLILGAGGLAEVDDDPNDVASTEPPVDGGDDSNTAAADADPAAAPEVPDPAVGPEPSADDAVAPPVDAGAADAGAVAPPPQEPAADDEVEVDVTSLVKGSEEAKQSADNASQNTDTLLAKFKDLENRVGAMAAISNKIETLEKEIIKRNPTPIESLEMRSTKSFPYNIKLTDYWKDVEGYDADGEDKTKEYILTQDDVDSDFADASIKKSFDDVEYDEEDF